MDKQLRRILDLVRRTGDRMVVTDANGEDAYVVMGLGQYESLIDCLSTDDGQDGYTGLDNCCESCSKFGSSPSEGAESSREEPSSAQPVDVPSDIWDVMQPAGAEGETWDIGAMSETEKIDLERQFQEYQKVKELEEKSVEKKDVPMKAEEDDFGEEQFYLEPVE